VWDAPTLVPSRHLSEAKKQIKVCLKRIGTELLGHIKTTCYAGGMNNNKTTTKVLKELRTQVADITADQAAIRILMAIDETLLHCVLRELEEIRSKVDALARTTATAATIDLVHTEIDWLERQFTRRPTNH
jgi:hypothetical protein